jgi:hypothetical protein
MARYQADCVSTREPDRDDDRRGEWQDGNGEKLPEDPGHCVNTDSFSVFPRDCLRWTNQAQKFEVFSDADPISCVNTGFISV